MGICLVMRNNLLRSLRHKLLFVLTFLLPIALCLLSTVVNLGKTSIRVGVLMDENSSFPVTEVYKLLDQSVGLQNADANQTSINTDLITGKYHVILDYRGSSSVSNFQIITYQNKEKSTLLKQMFQQALQKNEPINLEQNNKTGLTVTGRSIAILITLFMIFSTIYCSGMIRDRQSGLLQRYQSAGQSSKSYIFGYVLYTFIIMIIQILICMAILPVVQKTIHISLLQGAVLSLAIAVISTIFGVLICVGSKSEVQANITASSITAIMSLLGGTFVAIQNMPGLLKILSYASPVRWIMELYNILITF